MAPDEMTVQREDDGKLLSQQELKKLFNGTEAFCGGEGASLPCVRESR